MTHAPMVDLKRDPPKAEKLEMAVPTTDGAPEYPYGCCLSLDDETLDKVGLDGDLPALGELIHGCFVAKVTSASVNQNMDMDGKPRECKRVELQIIQMGIPTAARDTSKRWYGDNPDEDER